MKLFSILKKDLMILLRDRAEMAVLFLMPLAFIIPISLALGSGDGYGVQRGNEMIPLPVINYDGGARAQVLMTAIGEGLRLETTFDMDVLRELGLDADPVCVPPPATPTETPTAAPTDTAAPTRTPDPSATPEPLPTATPEGPTATPTTTPEPQEPVTSPSCNEKVARAMLQRSWRVAALVIPEGFSEGIDGGAQQQVTLLYDPAGDSTRLMQVEGVVEGAAVRVSLENQLGSGKNQLEDLIVFAPQNVQQSVIANSQIQPTDQAPAIALQKVAPANYQFPAVPDTYQQTIPGYTVMYVFFIISTIAGSIREERLNGTFRRLLSSPVSRVELLGGKMLAAMMIGLAQVVLLFLVGVLLFGLGLGNDPLAFVLLTVVLVACAAAIGLLASTTRLSGGGLAAPLIISALLGGSMFPLDLMPPVLRALSYITPHRWALTGYQNLMVRGQGLQETLPQIAVLLCFAAIFFLIAVWRFRFDE